MRISTGLKLVLLLKHPVNSLRMYINSSFGGTIMTRVSTIILETKVKSAYRYKIVRAPRIKT